MVSSLGRSSTVTVTILEARYKHPAFNCTKMYITNNLTLFSFTLFTLNPPCFPSHEHDLRCAQVVRKWCFSSSKVSNDIHLSSSILPLAYSRQASGTNGKITSMDRWKRCESDQQCRCVSWGLACTKPKYSAGLVMGLCDMIGVVRCLVVRLVPDGHVVGFRFRGSQFWSVVLIL